MGLYLWPSKARADKAPQLHSSPRCAETLTINSISEGEKRCSQFDALGNHVMKNRLLRIRISQALPHRVLSSRIGNGVCVVGVSKTCAAWKKKHAWYLRGNILPFLITVWSGMWIPWSSGCDTKTSNQFLVRKATKSQPYLCVKASQDEQSQTQLAANVSRFLWANFSYYCPPVLFSGWTCRLK